MRNQEFVRRFPRTAGALEESPASAIDFGEDLDAVRRAAALSASEFEEVVRRLTGIFGVTVLSTFDDLAGMPPESAGLDESIDAAWSAVVRDGNEALRKVAGA